MGTIQDRINYYIERNASAANESPDNSRTLKARIDEYLRTSAESKFPAGSRKWQDRQASTKLD